MKARYLTALPLALAAVACGTTMPPKELSDARTQYAMTSQGAAATETPAELHSAQVALAKAEKDFQDNGDEPQVRDEAYVALRKAQIAEATAQANLALKAKANAEQQAQRNQAQSLQSARAALSATTNQLGKSEAARAEAEKKAAMAMADLQKVASSVKQETRGMVITLSGSVLFATDQSTLLPDAMLKINDVAEALIRGNPDSNITIEGHTDTQGNHDHNMMLSQKRAESVKAQLVSRGVAADRIKTVGVGPDRPIADNKSAEGRANNRRVEIIVEPSGATPTTTTTTTTQSSSTLRTPSTPAPSK